jgi:adenine-specific DNA-methyltransferase
VIAKKQQLRVVFRDAGFKDDNAKINVEQIFRLLSPHTDVKTI